MFSGLSAPQPSARRWTALTSFTLQAVVVAVALFFPMLYPQNLPPVFLARRIFVPVSNGEVRADTDRRRAGSGGPTRPAVLIVSRDPFTFSKARTPAADTGPDAPPLGDGSRVGIDLGPIVSISPTTLPHAPEPAPPLRLSRMMEGNLIRRVEPQYPIIAKQIHLEGAVVLKAIISREGNIERLEVASGPGLLAHSAVDAVRQWQYRPYLLNDEPVEVETQITVNFVLEH
jgi:protein TonB